MSEIRTENTIRNEFCKKLHNWQCKKLLPIEDLSYVILNMLKEKFVIEIDGHKYDLSFGLNNETGEIGYSWSSYPSPHLMSYQIIDKAFKEGKWFKVLDEDLPKEEVDAMLNALKEKEQKETEAFLKEFVERLQKEGKLDK